MPLPKAPRLAAQTLSLVNEAALLAARKDKDQVEMEDLQNAKTKSQWVQSAEAWSSQKKSADAPHTTKRP